MLHAMAEAVKAIGRRRRARLRRRRRPLRRGRQRGPGDFRRQDRRHAGARPVEAAPERDLRRRRQVDRAFRHRSRARRQRRQGRLLEDRPFAHQAPRARSEGARRLREVGPFLLQRAGRARLRRRLRHRDRRPRHARPQSGEVDGRSLPRSAEDLGLADHVAPLRRRSEIRRSPSASRRASRRCRRRARR